MIGIGMSKIIFGFFLGSGDEFDIYCRCFVYCFTMLAIRGSWDDRIGDTMFF